MDVLKLAEQLVRIESASGNEKEIGEYIYQLVKEIGFKVKKQKVDKSFNVIAVKGKPQKVLSAHMDTVLPYVPFRKKGGFIYGRGSCDTKGSVASMIVAGERLIEYADDFGLLFTVREETDFKGIRRAIKTIRPRYFVVGEPTNNTCVFGQKGIIDMRIEFKGKAAHSARPQMGENAIMKMNDAINKLKLMKLNKEESFNVGKVSGGIAPNIVPDRAEMTVSFRTTANNMRIINYVKKLGGRVVVDNSFEEVSMPKFIKCKKSAERTAGFTEMYFLAKYGRGVICGPGNAMDAHSKNEKVGISELKKAPGIYEKLISGF